MSALIMSKKNENSLFIRKILQTNLDGYNLVQDFYNTGQKRTDPFLIPSNFTSFNPFNYLRFSIDKIITFYKTGEKETEYFPLQKRYIIWYINGQKAHETNYKNIGTEYAWLVEWYTNGQKYSEEITINKRNSLKYWHKNGLLASENKGYIETYWYENGQIRCEEHLLGYTPDGIKISWYPNGQKMTAGYHDKEKKEYIWDYWYENGQQWKKEIYKKGKHFSYSEWYKTGEIKLTMYFVEGKLNGLCSAWYKNGSKKFEEYYSNGKKHGISKSYHPINNNIYCEIEYFQGIGTGHWVEWYDNGKKNFEGNIINGFKEGLWSSWYENSLLKQQGCFKQDIEIGLWTYWHENGQESLILNYSGIPNNKESLLHQANRTLAQQLEFTCSKIEGSIIESYKNGQKYCQGYKKHNKKIGHWQFWHENGQLMIDGYYDNGSPNGVWTFLSEQGEKLAEAIYQKGLHKTGYLPPPPESIYF